MSRANVSLIDDVDFFVDTRDVGTILSVAATATSTQTSASLQNTGSGAVFYTTFTTVAATATVRLMVQGQDPASKVWITVASLSIDGISTTNTVNGFQLQSLWVTPFTGLAVPTGGTAVVLSLPRTLRVQASITATASAGGAALSMLVGMTRLGVI